MTQLRFEKVDAMPSELVKGTIYFDKSSNLIKIATDANAYDVFSGVCGVDWDGSVNTLSFVNERGENIVIENIAITDEIISELNKVRTGIGFVDSSNNYTESQMEDTSYIKDSTTVLDSLKALDSELRKTNESFYDDIADISTAIADISTHVRVSNSVTPKKSEAYLIMQENSSLVEGGVFIWSMFEQYFQYIRTDGEVDYYEIKPGYSISAELPRGRRDTVYGLSYNRTNLPQYATIVLNLTRSGYIFQDNMPANFPVLRVTEYTADASIVFMQNEMIINERLATERKVNKMITDELSDYYTTTETDTLLENKADKEKVDIMDVSVSKLVDDVSFIENNAIFSVVSDSSAITATKDGSVVNISGDFDDYENLKEVTYAELKALRDNAKLTAGMNYRITDYQCTTTQADTRSANHPFDIIVTADSANTLNENAYAALHEGDTYFANNDLTAWKLKYCLDNDTSRFAWANATNGKGVIFYMKDEFNNECWYDFKNIQYKFAYLNIRLAGLEANLYYFTFTINNSNSQSAIRDNSLLINCRCNRIGPRYSENKYFLSFNVFRSTNTNNNCYHNVLGEQCYHNLANTEFRLNVLGDGCNYNVFGINNYYVNFGAGCRNNTFHGNVNIVSFGKTCVGNTSAGSSNNVWFGDTCENNYIGEQVSNVFFDRNCKNNNIDRLCKRIKCGVGCNSNETSGAAENITFGMNCVGNLSRTLNNINIKFGNNVAYCTVTKPSTDKGRLQNVVVLDGTKGTSESKVTISVAGGKAYTQYAGRKSDGKLRIWNIADIGDLEEKDNIIDVTVLPTTDIDTQTLYRLTTTHYYHNDTELADAPQGYKSLNEEALVADENGLTAIEGETSTTTPWAEVTDAMIATLVSGSLVATCEFGEAGFFKTAADEYDYAGNFYTIDTYTLWHNPTGNYDDWQEVSSVSSLVTDGVTTVDASGMLQANAIIPVNSLPTTNIKEDSFYRVTETIEWEEYHYSYNGTPVENVTLYSVDDTDKLVVTVDGFTLIDSASEQTIAWTDVSDELIETLLTDGIISVVETGSASFCKSEFGYDIMSAYTIDPVTEAFTMTKVFGRENGAWKSHSVIRLTSAQYKHLSDAQKNDGTVYIRDEGHNSLIDFDYATLSNQPSINNVLLEGNKSWEDLGLPAGENMQEVTYAELKTLRDESKLEAGKWYRIINYVTTTTQADTRSANHQFDIIVKADGENVLNEDAHAALHDGDTYFANSDLAAWNLKYRLDNDTSRFAWADPNGKGVIYYMKDEFDNECSYDFKNIQFKRYLITRCDKVADLEGLYLGTKENAAYNIDEEDFIWCYTFAWINENSEIEECSMVGQFLADAEGNYQGVHSNVIEECVTVMFSEEADSFQFMLNNIVFQASYDYEEGIFYGIYNNTFGTRCSNNTFGNECNSNTFGINCSSNTFGDRCSNNTFSYDCYNNIFGQYCHENIFSNNCESNTFNRECYNNIFGSYFCRNTVGDDCAINTFGINCDSNTFGSNCVSNTIGEGFSINTLDDEFEENTIGKHCHNNTFGNNCKGNTFDYNFTNNIFGNNCSYNTLGSNCVSNTFGNYCQDITVFNGVHHCSVTGGTVQAPIKNAQILNGTAGPYQNKLTITFAANKNYTQVAAKTTEGKLRIWNIADIGNIEQKNSIIDVTELPIEDIDTQSLYRLSEEHYYYQGQELDENENTMYAGDATDEGLIFEGQVYTWENLDDEIIAQIHNEGYIEVTDYTGCTFFRGDVNVYRPKSDIDVVYTYTLWHNPTGEPMDWIEVDTVADLMTDGITTEGVEGKLQANAVIDATALPVSGIKAKSLYRTCDVSYEYEGVRFPKSELVWYGPGPACTSMDADDAGVNIRAASGNSSYSWDTIDDTLIQELQGRNLVAVGVAEVNAVFFSHTTTYGPKSELTVIYGDYHLYHNPTETAGEYIEIGGDSMQYVSTFAGVAGSTEVLYYLDTAYDNYKKGFYRYSGTTFVNINPTQFFYVSTFTGVKGDIDALYYLDTAYDEYTIGFYRYIEVEESGVTVGKFIHISDPKQLQVTYSRLKEMRDQAMLIPGMQYRITDYVTTTAQANTRSANHPFDIIVTADETNVLNENCHAALHDGDSYFSDSSCHLESWQLKYCIDNDINRFAWADASNGKGVIYYMKDEFNNECPYDFKNIMFKRKITFTEGYPKLDLAGGVDTWCYTFTATKYDIASGTWSEIVDGSLESPHGHMSDEGFGTYHNNIIKEYIEIYNDDEDRSKAGLAYLSNNVFLGYFEYNGWEGDYQYAYCSDSNTLGVNCHGNTFGNGCIHNTFGNGCTHNTFGNGCTRNTFWDDCLRNTFGDSCSNNTFGRRCKDNTFGSSCGGNTFGRNCYSNTFGNSCGNNTFGTGCYSNTFGNSCGNNTFKNLCYNNAFGNDCTHNTFGSSCGNNTFGSRCNSNTFGSSCTGNTFGNSCSGNTFFNRCENIEMPSYSTYIEITMSKNVVLMAASTTDANNYLCNIKIEGVCGESSNKKTIVHPTTNDNFITIYRPKDSQIISV